MRELIGVLIIIMLLPGILSLFMWSPMGGHMMGMMGFGWSYMFLIPLAFLALIGFGAYCLITEFTEPRKVVNLSRKTYSKMVQNLWWAAGYNIFAIPLAAGVLYNMGIMISPAIGALLMSLSTVIVAINSQTLRKYEPKVIEPVEKKPVTMNHPSMK